ncbi:hypothetical protein VE01_03115 [Pseudogymnoascus verrucosus]|uniref:RecA family profile 1 domain-containing protein n=1 Tax=Pseudogymnoascus verrucosus TaxID=342668 RepID=A0A1B8GR07_9PEZI|nr:uncharacterized protein VE01_03115 [Pseudogymnoascus verrucosus]OBT98266.1 hypothetical protein VE01_03115 [Pseudogymnoascus verrucosus]
MLWFTKRRHKPPSTEESLHAVAPTRGFLEHASSRIVEAPTQVLYTDPNFAAPPPLNYSLRTRKWSLAIFWFLIFLDCICMPLALYFGLWYGTHLSHNAVFSISTGAIGIVSVIEYFIRFRRLWKKGSTCRVIGARRWYLDWFHWNLSLAWIAVMIELIIGTIPREPPIRLLAMPVPSMVFAFGLELALVDGLRLLGIPTPVRISSVPAGVPLRPGVYSFIEDVCAVDGSGGTEFRQRLNLRYMASKPFRKMLHRLTLFWATGALAIATASTAMIFTLSRNAAYVIGWTVPFGWAAVWTLITTNTKPKYDHVLTRHHIAVCPRQVVGTVAAAIADHALRRSKGNLAPGNTTLDASMTDLSSILPAFPTAPYAHLLPSLERQSVSTTDLLTLDPAALAKRANIPVEDVTRLCTDVLKAIQRDLGLTGDDLETSHSSLRGRGNEISKKWDAISTLDPNLDSLLSGGFPAGYITEVTGESGSGKTQLLLLLLLTVQLPSPHGLNRSAIYITTESSLPTTRLAQLRAAHPILADTSLSRVLTIPARDLETQDHILRFQLPLAIRRHNVGLVVIDSVAANFRAEFERGDGGGAAHGANMARRTAELVGLGALLRGIARSESVAVVVSNQVADRFAPLSVGEGPPRGS